jgi:hypothetical protein
VAADLDVDADGWPDIVVSDPATDHLSVWLGRPGGPAASPDRDWVGPRPLGGGWGARIAHAGDVDGDGHDDLLVTSTWSGSDGHLGRVRVLRGTAPAWTHHRGSRSRYDVAVRWDADRTPKCTCRRRRPGQRADRVPEHARTEGAAAAITLPVRPPRSVVGSPLRRWP